MKKRPWIVLIIFLILALLIFINNTFAPIQFISSIFQNIFKSPKAAVYNIKAGVSSSTNSQDEIKKLKNENEALTQKLINYDRVMRDNDAFRSQFDTTETKDYTLMPAKVIGFTGAFLEPSTLIIDHGSSNNLKSGMAVVFKNNLVGKIGKVSSYYSEVTLTGSQQFVTLAKSADNSSSGVARGNVDFILLDNVSINDTLNKDTLLLTSGNVDQTGVGIPPDLVIGKIVSVNKSASLPFQTAKVESLINSSKLEMVFVVEKY